MRKELLRFGMSVAIVGGNIASAGATPGSSLDSLQKEGRVSGQTSGDIYTDLGSDELPPTPDPYEDYIYLHRSDLCPGSLVPGVAAITTLAAVAGRKGWAGRRRTPGE